MDQERLDELIDKYAFGTISPEELQELLEWYHSAEITTVEWPTDQLGEKDQLKERMLLRLHSEIRAASAKEATSANGAIPLDPAIPAASRQANSRRASSRQATPRRIFRLRPWQAAAALILIASAIWLTRQYQHNDQQWVTVNNPTGKIRAIRLPDSSEVWLNAASTIRYSANANTTKATREVYLEGEAYFDIQQDQAHPFIVHAGKLTTTVLGTRFDIKSFPNEPQAEISVITGKVRVRDSTRILDVLTSARQLQVDARTGNATTTTIDTAQVQGWRWGKLQYSGQTMEEITASLGRWYNVQFVFTDPATSQCRYYLNFDNTISLQQLLKALKETTDLNFNQDPAGHKITVEGKGCH